MAACPNCLSKYWVLPKYEGRNVHCKGCGEVFVIVFDEQPPDSAPAGGENSSSIEKAADTGLRITGDLEPREGLIEVEGQIIVSGAVKKGVRLKSTSLSAREIAKSEITVDRDVTVIGGIIGATIRAGGRVKATYILDSDIETAGSVIIGKESRYSRIQSNGKYLSPEGSIISSSISARLGMEISDVGSETAEPSTVMVGVNVKVRQRIERIKEEINSEKKLLDQADQKVQAINEKIDRLVGRMEAPAHQVEQTLEQMGPTQSLVECLQAAGDQSSLGRALMTLKQLMNTRDECRDILEQFLAEQDSLLDELDREKQKRDEHGHRVRNMTIEANRLSDCMPTDKDQPHIKVFGTVHSGTVLKGCYAKLIVKKEIVNGVVRESKLGLSGGQANWDMIILAHEDFEEE